MVKTARKMAGVSTITLLLLCCFFITSTASQSPCDYTAATGSNFTVRLEHQLETSQKLKWKFNSDIIFKGEAPVSGENIYPNGFLKLTNLNKNNEGKYTPEVHGTDGKSLGTFQSKTLCVLDLVTKPKVMVTCPKAQSSKNKSQKTTPKTSVTFTCEVKDVKSDIKWFKDNVLLSEKTNPLTLEAEQVATDSFTCKVSNPVSSMTSDPVKQTCVNSRFSFFFDKVMGVQIWIIIACGGGVVVLLILIVIVCCVMNKRKKQMNLKDEEELRLNWTNDRQQHQQHQHQHQHQHKHHEHNHPPDQHHHHSHHHQQQPAGHTGPRQHRAKQHREQRPRAPEPPPGHPQPSPRRAAQAPGPGIKNDEEQPPPLPQPRRQGPKTTRGNM